MSLRFVDSFDHYVTADIPKKWTLAVGSPTINAGIGRRGTAGVRIASSSRYFRKDLDAQSTWIVGFAHTFGTLPNVSSAILEFRDVALALQCDLRVTILGELQVTRAGTILGTSTLRLTASAFQYIEMALVIHTTTGSAVVRVNEVPWLTLTNVNTQATANASALSIYVGQPGGSSAMVQNLDDLYICDGTGAAPYNTFLGDCRVDCLYPNADGSNSAWTPSAGTTHFNLVDDPTPTEDTDYLITTTVGARDTHALTNLPTLPGSVVYGVQHSLYARKDDAGLRQVKSVLKSGATTQVGANLHTLATSYIYYTEMFTADPNTGAAWTIAAVDALEAGIEGQ
jgi:hypothetical protein